MNGIGQGTIEDRQLQIEVLQSIPATAWTVTASGQLDFVNRFYLDVMGQTFEQCAAPLDEWNKSGNDLPPFCLHCIPTMRNEYERYFGKAFIQVGDGHSKLCSCIPPIENIIGT